MSIATEISRLQSAKADIKTAIEGLGQTVPDATKLDGYPPYIQGISGGSWLPSAQTILETFSRKVSEHRGPATIEKIYGRTIIWNQKINIPSTDQSTTINGVTFTDNRDGSYTVSTDANGATADASFSGPAVNSAIGGSMIGHRVLLRGCPKGGSTSTYYLSSASLYAWDTGDGAIETPASTLWGWPRIMVKAGTVITTPVVFRPQFVDLTQATLDEITTPGQFSALYPLPYYAYDPGSLQSLAPDALVTRGINQWDEEWELGYWDNSGTIQPAPDRICSSHKIPVLPNTQYYIKVGTGTQNGYINEFRADGSHILRRVETYNRVITTGENTYYIAISPGRTATTYNHDICINISNPAINGQYFPYRYCRAGINLQNFPYGMNDAGADYDEMTPSKDTRRLGMVDLGDYNWSIVNMGTYSFFRTQISDARYTNTSSLKCPKYPTVQGGSSALANNNLAITNGIPGLYAGILIRDDSYSDTATFKAAMSGVPLIYALATPVETAVNHDLTFLADEGGTQEVTPITAPFQADIRYAKDI